MNSIERPIGFYRYIENIKNFKLKIKVHRSLASSLIKSHLFEDGDDNYEEEKSLYDEKVILWQEKHFSTNEIKKYSLNNDYENYTEKKYQHLINSSIKNSDDEAQKKNTNENSWMRITTITNEDIALNNHLFKIKNKCIEVMFIVLEMVEEEKNFTLCKIYVNPKKETLTIEPDFNDINKNPYIISEGNDLGAAKIEYGIENASIQLPRDEQELKFHLLMKLKNIQKMHKLLNFKIVKKMGFSGSCISFFGEIVSATGFGRKNIHIEYWISRNSSWISDNPLYGTTVKSIGSETINFSSTFEFTLYSELLSSMELENAKLHLRVVSTNFLNEEITEGFGTMIIPLAPGKYENIVEIYQIFSPNPFDRMKQYFLGANFNIINIEKSKRKPIGLLWSQSKGNVQINFNIVLQASNFQNYNVKTDSNINIKESNISNIVSAFRRAQQRMLQLNI